MPDNPDRHLARFESLNPEAQFKSRSVQQDTLHRDLAVSRFPVYRNGAEYFRFVFFGHFYTQGIHHERPGILDQMAVGALYARSGVNL